MPLLAPTVLLTVDFLALFGDFAPLLSTGWNGGTVLSFVVLARACASPCRGDACGRHCWCNGPDCFFVVQAKIAIIWSSVAPLLAAIVEPACAGRASSIAAARPHRTTDKARESWGFDLCRLCDARFVCNDSNMAVFEGGLGHVVYTQHATSEADRLGCRAKGFRSGLQTARPRSTQPTGQITSSRDPWASR